MARNNQSFNRRERERAKKQKADDKRQRRLTRPDATDEETESTAAADQGAVLQQLAELNAAFEAGDVSFDDFEEQRSALLALIEVD